MSFPFTTLDELRRAEPDLALRHAAMPSDADAAPDPKRTPKTILTEVCTKLYSEPGAAKYIYRENLRDGSLIFMVTCTLRRLKGEGIHRTKRLAEHVAAFEVLKLLAKDPSYVEYMPGGKTTEEVMTYLNSLTFHEEMKATAPGDATKPESVENWVGRLNELASKHKLAQPDYAFTETGAPNDRIFTALCTIQNLKKKAEAKTKKASKALAARKMFEEVSKRLKETGSLETPNEVEPEDSSENSTIETTAADNEAGEKLQEVDAHPISALEDILHEESRFQSQEFNFRIFNYPAHTGEVQCLLTTKTQRVGSSQPDNHVFPGQGPSDDAARESAARMALIHFRA